tara:strand:- start:3203 stop:3610 length:408 start_codon:yes stop_codon:yes gene_type:complete
MENQEFELLFDDITMQETGGDFKKVEECMLSEFPAPKIWMLKSKLTIISMLGVADLEVDLYHTGIIYIISYEPSQKDVFYNSDLPALSCWAQQSGWQLPQPHPELVKSNMEFWKHFWDTNIVDSLYLENLYGEKA